jgi:hypothetical protein
LEGSISHDATKTGQKKKKPNSALGSDRFGEVRAKSLTAEALESDGQKSERQSGTETATVRKSPEMKNQDSNH